MNTEPTGDILSPRLNGRDLIEEMEELLLVWIREETERNNLLSGPLIRVKAQNIYRDVKTRAISDEENARFDDFEASKGWFEQFNQRCELRGLKIHKEDFTVNKEEDGGRNYFAEENICLSKNNIEMTRIIAQMNPIKDEPAEKYEEHFDIECGVADAIDIKEESLEIKEEPPNGEVKNESQFLVSDGLCHNEDLDQGFGSLLKKENPAVEHNPIVKTETTLFPRSSSDAKTHPGGDQDDNEFDPVTGLPKASFLINRARDLGSGDAPSTSKTSSVNWADIYSSAVTSSKDQNWGDTFSTSKTSSVNWADIPSNAATSSNDLGLGDASSASKTSSVNWADIYSSAVNSSLLNQSYKDPRSNRSPNSKASSLNWVEGSVNWADIPSNAPTSSKDLGLGDASSTSKTSFANRADAPSSSSDSPVPGDPPPPLLPGKAPPAAPKLYSCSECSYSTNKKSTYTIHLLKHSGVKRYSCMQCDYRTNFKQGLMAHTFKHNGAKLYKCFECQFETNHKHHLKSHSLIHSGGELFACGECGYRTNVKASLKAHQLNHNDHKAFRCESCGYQTNQKKDFNVHLLNHSGVKILGCDLCDYRTNWKSGMKSHMLTHTQADKGFECPDCEFKTSRKGVLKNHLLTHNEVKRFTCSQCPYQTNLKYSLKVHMYKHGGDGDRVLGCTNCSYTTNLKTLLRSHMLTHVAEKELRCDRCDFKTNRRGDFKKHRLVHSGVKVLKCPECPFETNWASNMKGHMLRHGNTKRFRCELCDFGTNWKSNMNSHMVVHGGTKRFGCTECSYRTNWKRSLVAHMLTHGVEPLAAVDSLSSGKGAAAAAAPLAWGSGPRGEKEGGASGSRINLPSTDQTV